jgi:tetratricopeptide (TPR) repeat protein
VTADRDALTAAADLLRRRSYAEAARALQSILQGAPHNADALQLLGLAQKHLGNLESATQSMMASLAIEPAQPHVLTNLGGVFLRKHEHENARRCFEKALEFDRSNKEAWRNLALALRGLGELSAAEEAARAAIAAAPTFVAARTLLAQILLELGDSAEASAEAARATTMDPSSAEAWRCLGATLHTSGRSQTAIGALERAIALQPHSAEAHAFLGAVYQSVGERELAKRAFQQALDIQPDYEKAHFALNQLLWTTADTGTFMNSYREAEQAEPDAMNIRCAHAHTLMLVERSEEAEEVLREAAQRNPGHPRTNALLGDVLSQRGQHQEALPLLERAQRDAPGAPQFKIGYARALLRAGAFEEALSQLDSCDPERFHKHDLDQEIVALTYVAARGARDERAQLLFDYSRLVRAWEIPAPEGFSSLEAFNEALTERLIQLHTTEQAPLEQTLRGGTQTYGRLFNNPDPLVQALRNSCAQLVQRYLDELPPLGDHPFETFRPSEAKFAGSWSVRLRGGGFHKNHFHGRGWLSSAYYVSLPPEMNATPGSRAGWLKFGQPHALPGADEPPEFWVKPERGLLALFPSYMWHGTETFASPEPRITVAFDTQSRAPTPGQLGNI